MGKVNRHQTWMWVPLLTLAAGCSREPAEPAAADLPAVSARLARVESTARAVDFTVTGSVESATVTTVGAKVMGQILSVGAEAGQSVQKGQVLVRIDDRDARAQVAQAEAALASAQAMLDEVDRAAEAAESGRDAAAAQAELAASTFQRFEQLLERQSVSRQEFDEVASRNQAAQAQLRQAVQMLAQARSRRPQVEAGIRQAEAGLSVAQNSLSYYTVTSPFTGVVSAKLVEAGQMSAPGMPLLTIEDQRRFEVHAVVDERRLSHVRRDLPVSVQLSGLGSMIEGKVTEIVPRADPVSRSFTVKVAIPSGPGLKSGQFATVSFPGTDEQRALVVPEASVVRRGQLVGVYAVDSGGKARFRLIKPGRQWDNQVEVLSGLAEGETVVVEPGPQLQDGSPVRASGAGPVQTEPAGEFAG